MDDVLTELRLAAENIERMGDTQRRFNAAMQTGQDALWRDLAEVRDDLHAVANRVENLTRALTAEPAEVAARIVTDANRATVTRFRPGDNRQECPDCGGTGQPDGRDMPCPRCSGFGEVLTDGNS